jgi:hypothetical protein
MYADRELRGDRVLLVEAHIIGCDECSSMIREMRQIEIALHSLSGIRAPHELVEKIVRIAAPVLQRSTWQAVTWTIGAIWMVAKRGFSVDDILEKSLRRESPPWVARWVLFV